MESIALRPRRAFEIVDATIEVYRRNPVHFMLLTAAVHAPWLVLQIVLLGNAPATSELGTSALIGLGTAITNFFMTAVVVQMASDLYLGRETDALLALQRVGNKLPTAFIASVIQGVLIVFGFAFFLIPAVYWSAIYFAVIPVIVLERGGLFASFDRSSRLSTGLRWHILAALGLVIIIKYTLLIGSALIVGIIPNVVTQRVLSTLIAVVVYPLTGISAALIYYDARIRSEGFDIEVMVGGTPAVSPQPSPI